MNERTKGTIKVSIITVAFNSAKTLEKTIESVTQQTYKNIEYIIVDGGSTDASLDIIRKYQDKIATWISEPDKGISDAFNKGIAMATGDIIGIINADDWYESNAVEVIVSNISNEFDVYCGNIKLIGEDERVSMERKSRVGWLNLGMYVMHPSVFVKSHVYRKVGKFDTNFRIAMDFDMMLRIKNQHFKFKYIDHEIAFMRAGGVSSDISKMFKEELKAMNKNLGGLTYVTSYLFNQFNRLRWRFFYTSPLHAKA